MTVALHPSIDNGVKGRDLLSCRRGTAPERHRDASAVIQRYACKPCGTHMYGRIENKNHPFYGLDFIHPELFQEQGSLAPQFAFVFSLIESGVKPEQMGTIRSRLKEIGLELYDCLSSAMDAIATHVAKNKAA